MAALFLSMRFTLQVGKEKIDVYVMTVSLICVTYKKQNHLFTYTKNRKGIVWKCFSLEGEMVEKIGKAIEDHITG